MRHRIRPVARLLLGLALLACGGGGTEPATTNVSLVTVSLPVSTLLVGSSTAASAKALDAAGAQLAGKSFTWSVLPSGVVTVGTDGVVTAVGAGTAQIVAKTEGVTGAAPITVVASAQISSLGGDAQSAVIGTAVATPPSVLVRDAGNNPLAGVPVVFAVTSGGGTVTGATATTSSAGIAQVGSWTLGATVGANSLRATIPSGGSTSFTATALPDPRVPVSLVVAAGNSQTGSIAEFVATDPRIRVLNANGAGVAGVTVAFTPSDNGAVSSATVVTDANGEASVRWRLGPAIGGQSLRAQAGALSVTLGATGQGIVSIAAGGNETAATGTVLGPKDPTVLVTTLGGAPVQGVPVQFITNGSGATVSATTATTDAQGLASTRWTLGSSLGNQILTVLVGTTQVQIIAVAYGPPASMILSVRSSASLLLVGDTAQAVVSVRDAIGSPVPDALVSWSSSAPAVATVSATGLVTAVSYGGPVTITATTSNNVARSFTITKVTTVTFDVPDSFGGAVRILVDQGPGTPMDELLTGRPDIPPGGPYRIRALSFVSAPIGMFHVTEPVSDVVASGILEGVVVTANSVTRLTGTLVRPEYQATVNGNQVSWTFTDPGSLMSGLPGLRTSSSSLAGSRCPYPSNQQDVGMALPTSESVTKTGSNSYAGTTIFASLNAGQCVQLFGVTQAPNAVYHASVFK